LRMEDPLGVIPSWPPWLPERPKVPTRSYRNPLLRSYPAGAFASHLSFWRIAAGGQNPSPQNRHYSSGVSSRYENAEINGHPQRSKMARLATEPAL
jgi:hypothetical protein